MAKTLTAVAVRNLKPGAKRREIPDSFGLMLIIQPSGTKTWAMRFRGQDGRSTKLTLGPVVFHEETHSEPVIGAPLTLSAARRLAASVQQQRALGVVVKKRKALPEADLNLFPDAARFYIEHGRAKSKHNRNWHKTARVLGLNTSSDSELILSIIPGGLAERWADKPIAQVTTDDLFQLVDEARERGIPGRDASNKGSSEARAREMAQALKTMFKWLFVKRWIKHNPAADIPSPEAARKRALVLNVLSNVRGADELRAFWQGCEKVGYPFGPFCQLLLLTGARREELAAMTWDELSDDHTEWRLAGSRTKNGLPHNVPLPPLAKQILERVPRAHMELAFESKGFENRTRGFVFTTNGRTQISGFSKMKRRLDREMKNSSGTVIPHWTLHDLRRTFCTGCNEIGIAPHIVEACVNHVSGAKAGVAGTYNRAIYAEEKRSALVLWAGYILGIVAGGNVVPMRKRKR